MAVARTTPPCQYCGKPTAKGIYKNESGVPAFMRKIGDSFIRWEHWECNCIQTKKARKEWKVKTKKYWQEVFEKEGVKNLEELLSKGR